MLALMLVKLNNFMGNMENKCNHNLLEKKCSLIEIAKMEMVSPQQVNFFCPYCNKFFKYIKVGNGTLLLKKE